jgi:hypothetical protein
LTSFHASSAKLKSSYHRLARGSERIVAFGDFICLGRPVVCPPLALEFKSPSRRNAGAAWSAVPPKAGRSIYGKKRVEKAGKVSFFSC